MAIFTDSMEETPATDSLLLAALRQDSHEAYFTIFRRYYAGLVVFCGQFIPDRYTCEDIVQDVMTKLWAERRELVIRRSLKSFLTALVQNRALDELRHNRVKSDYATGVHLQILSLSPEEHMFYSDLDNALREAMATLSEPVRATLSLRLNHNLSYPQIARRLGVSQRTVETRMSKALKIIRESLRHYRLPVLAGDAVLLNNTVNNIALWI